MSITLQANGISSRADVVGFHAHEALGRLSTLTVVVRARQGEVDADAALDTGSAARFVVPAPGESLAAPRIWSGVVSAIELAHGSPAAAGDEGDLEYWRITISPKLWALTQTMHSRIFVDKSVPQVIEAVLRAEGLSSADYRLALTGDHPTFEHVTQLRESSWDFVSRLMEREGIYTFFDRANGEDVVVFADDASAHPSARALPIPFRALEDAVQQGPEGLAVLSSTHRAVPRGVRVTDYDYLRPSAALAADLPLAGRTNGAAAGVVTLHGEFVPTPGGEARYARLRAEEMLARETLFVGRGRFHELACGASFTASGPIGDARFGVELLAIEVEHVGSELGKDSELAELLELEAGQGVQTRFTAIPLETQFRSVSSTPAPRVHGVVDGMVDAASAGSYAPIDSHGRYKVKLRFDEGEGPGGGCSTWIRMLQPHGGGTEGFHFPLRKDTELQVAFLGGDPDRPVIVGVAPNAIERSVVRQSNASTNVIHTGGDNDITMEDASGGQFITSSTPTAATKLHLGAGSNQIELRTDGQGHLHIGQNLDVDVHANKIESVTGALKETYSGFQKLEVSGAVARTFQALQDQTVGGPVTEIVTGLLDETVGASVDELYQAGQSTTVDGAVTISYGGTLDHTVNAGPLTEAITGLRKRDVGGTWGLRVSAHVEEAFGATKRNITGDYTETAGGTFTIEAPSIKVYATHRKWIDSAVSLIESVKNVTDSVQNFLGTELTSIAGIRASGTGGQLTLCLSHTSRSNNRLKIKLPSKLVARKKTDVFSFGLLKHGVHIKLTGILIFQ